MLLKLRQTSSLRAVGVFALLTSLVRLPLEDSFLAGGSSNSL
jgi:hypothetical protein